MAQHVDDGDGDDCPELPQELVCDHSTEDRTEVAEHGEGVVDGGSAVLGEVELLVEIDAEDGLHAIVREPLAELIPDDEEDLLGVLEIHLKDDGQFVRGF